jgi:hypothetical protein
MRWKDEEDRSREVRRQKGSGEEDAFRALALQPVNLDVRVSPCPG